MKVHDLKPAPGSRQAKKRVGRGIGGKGGKTAGRGSKGQGARNNISPRFEGGQTPIHRRTPKAKGFNNPFRIEYHVVNLTTLEVPHGLSGPPQASTQLGPAHTERLSDCPNPPTFRSSRRQDALPRSQRFTDLASAECPKSCIHSMLPVRTE